MQVHNHYYAYLPAPPEQHTNIPVFVNRLSTECMQYPIWRTCLMAMQVTEQLLGNAQQLCFIPGGHHEPSSQHLPLHTQHAGKCASSSRAAARALQHVTTPMLHTKGRQACWPAHAQGSDVAMQCAALGSHTYFAT
jgi:hypothetical protein